MQETFLFSGLKTALSSEIQRLSSNPKKTIFELI